MYGSEGCKSIREREWHEKKSDGVSEGSVAAAAATTGEEEEVGKRRRQEEELKKTKNKEVGEEKVGEALPSKARNKDEA